MKIEIEPTDEMYLAETLVPGPDKAQVCRLWKGTTDDGVPVHAYILAVSPQTHDEGVALRFATELQQCDVRVKS